MVSRPKDWERRFLDKHLAKLADYSRSRAVPVFVALLNNRWSEIPFLERRLPVAGIPFVNGTVALRGREFRDYVLHPLDHHPNSAAHELFADEIYPPLVAAIQRARRGS